MKHKKLLFLAFVALSCNMNTEKNVSLYYDTDSLMKSQKSILAEKNARIVKWAAMNGDTSTTTIKPDSLQAWNDEFQFLEKININKPALQGLYEIKDYNDTRSNLQVREYYTNEEDLEVPFLRLYFLRSPDQLRILEAKYTEKNPIFNAQRNLRLIFDNLGGELLLREYTITGSQDMVLQDSITFHIKGKIKF